MPLHLLGKKSWNVYNKSNIERVHRDEAEAQAKQQELERKQRDDDAAERLELLRGEDTSALESTGGKRKRQASDRDSTVSGTKRPRSVQDSHSADARPDRNRANISSDPLDLNKISNMRFRDAAGRNNHNARKPWYVTPAPSDESQPSLGNGTNVWGKEDAGRSLRDKQRLDASDPMLVMKRGVKQLREVERQKEEWRKERERDLGEVEVLARRKEPWRERDRHRHRSRDAYRVDQDHENTRRRRGKDTDSRPHRSRHRSRSPKRQGGNNQ